MFIIKNVRIVSCEEKDWSVNGKSGKFYPTMIRMQDGKVFSISSKSDLRDSIDLDVNIELELQSKTPKIGNPYTGIRILGVAV